MAKICATLDAVEFITTDATVVWEVAFVVHGRTNLSGYVW
jgi:hypothetical protein